MDLHSSHKKTKRGDEKGDGQGLDSVRTRIPTVSEKAVGKNGTI